MGPPAEAARRTHGLSHLERRILAGALDTADRRIQVFPTVGSAEGEIKVGTLRMQGHEALAAVDRLHDAGLIEWTDGAFAVTRDGRRAIERR